MFADTDLRQFAEVLAVPDYPRRLAKATAQIADAPWMYTGGLENQPREIARLSGQRRLFGNGPEVLRVLRNPARVRQLLAAADLPALEVRSSHHQPPADGNWMLKPLRGSAGRGIEIWTPAAANSATLAEMHYFQRRQTGVEISALYLALPGRTWLLGVCRQLIGWPELNARPFGFCGALAPYEISARSFDCLERTGDVLREGSAAQGLFGCDFLLNGEIPWLTEVNPRYTASTELFDHLYQTSLVDWHCRACTASGPTAIDQRGVHELEAEIAVKLRQPLLEKVAKAIVFAPWAFETPSLAHRIPPRIDFASFPDLADVPPEGTRIGLGEPICSLFHRDVDADSCLGGLLTRLRTFEQEIELDRQRTLTAARSDEFIFQDGGNR